MTKLIFETTKNHDGTLVDPPHRIVKNVKSVEVVSVADDDHAWLIVRHCGNHREIARMWEIGTWWTVGEYGYDELRIEA